MNPGFWFGLFFIAVGLVLYWASLHQYNAKTGKAVPAFTQGKYRGAAYANFAFGTMFALPNLMAFVYTTFLKH